MWIFYLANQVALYAYDLVLIARSISDLQAQITSLGSFCKENGLWISTDYTKV